MKITKVKPGDVVERRDAAGVVWSVEFLEVSPAGQIRIRAFDRDHGHIVVTKKMIADGCQNQH